MTLGIFPPHGPCFEAAGRRPGGADPACASTGHAYGSGAARTLAQLRDDRLRAVSARVDVIVCEADTPMTAVARLKEVGSMHARVAFYLLRSGTFEQVVRMVDAPGGLLEIFRGSPGFQGYELIEAPRGLISVSHWDSSAQAERATHAAAEWVAEHVEDRIKLQQSDIGEVVLSSPLAAATR